MTRRLFHRILSRRAELDEAALALPILLLVSIGLVNLAMLGFAAMNAANAANYAARIGSVAQANPAGVAAAAAHARLAAVRIGTYSVSVSGGGLPGSVIDVAVSYRVPNYFGTLSAILGVAAPNEFSGSARARFRQEGW